MSLLTWLAGAKVRLATKSVKNVIVERETLRSEAGDLSGSHSVKRPGLSVTETSVKIISKVLSNDLWCTLNRIQK